MPTARVRISITVDGTPLAGFPIARRIESPTESVVVDEICPAASSRTVVFGTGLQKVFALQTDRRITMRLFGQAAGQASKLNPGGLLLILNATLSGNVFVDNAGTQQARVSGAVLG